MIVSVSVAPAEGRPWVHSWVGAEPWADPGCSGAAAGVHSSVSAEPWADLCWCHPQGPAGDHPELCHSAPGKDSFLNVIIYLIIPFKL